MQFVHCTENKVNRALAHTRTAKRRKNAVFSSVQQTITSLRNNIRFNFMRDRTHTHIHTGLEIS